MHERRLALIVNGQRQYSKDREQGGMELPAIHTKVATDNVIVTLSFRPTHPHHITSSVATAQTTDQTRKIKLFKQIFIQQECPSVPAFSPCLYSYHTHLTLPTVRTKTFVSVVLKVT